MDQDHLAMIKSQIRGLREQPGHRPRALGVRVVRPLGAALPLFQCHLRAVPASCRPPSSDHLR
uniref:Uncharacterized protein n=1 Tax=uncultured marine virus TaxID=186617 RepID=A0A0F7L382_9VIRU|nr:hypothetical protein [uncultured marine virus]